jgi:hypothetical protein
LDESQNTCLDETESFILAATVAGVWRTWRARFEREISQRPGLVAALANGLRLHRSELEVAASAGDAVALGATLGRVLGEGRIAVADPGVPPDRHPSWHSSSGFIEK